MQILNRKLYIVLAFALLLLLLCACGSEPSAPTGPDKINQGSIADTKAEENFPALPATEQGVAQLSPEPTAEPTPEPTPEITPEPRLPRVEDSYFEDAAFFGNSLVSGLHSFGGLQYGSFFAGTSASVISVETIRDTKLSDGQPATLLDALLEQQHSKIYVLLGINELGFNTGAFVNMYAELLDKIAAAQPDAELFVMSLTPITEQRSKSEDLFTREKVLEFNEAIYAMTVEHGYTYLDLYDAFADENGWLPAEKSSDGVHFTVDTYLEWAEYMRTHYDGAEPSV